MQFKIRNFHSFFPVILAAAIGIGWNADAASQSVRIRPGAVRSLNTRNVGQALLNSKSLSAIAKLKPAHAVPDTAVAAVPTPATPAVAPAAEDTNSASTVTQLDLSALTPFPLGDYTLSLPQCITVNESGPDFILGACRTDIDFDAWIFNESYKISTPEAYINHLKRNVTRIESSANRGALREITGYDAPTHRNFYVALIPDGNRLYVVRLRFNPSLAEQINEKVIPNLISL